MRKYSIFLIFALCLLFLGQASAWTSSEFTRDEIKSLDKLTNFGTYEIKESAWYDPLKIWTEETVKSIELKTNTEQCVNCLSEGTIVLNKDGTLIDDLIWKRSFDNGKTFVNWKGYTNWKLLVEEDVDVFETTCKDGKEIIDEKNGTSYFEQDCVTSKTGTTKQWNNLDFKKEYKAGTYNYKIEGSKKASVTYDWIIKTNGELLTNWAVWGAVIGVGGVEANITINSPANNSIQYTNSVTTSATANVTSGAYLTNASLNLSVNGGAWEIRNTTGLTTIGGDGLVSYYKLDETSGTTAFDSVGNNDGTSVGATINQAGKIDKAYSFDGVNDYINTNFVPIVNANLTWAGWFKTSSSSFESGQGHILTNTPGTNNAGGLSIFMENDGKISVATGSGTGLTLMGKTTNAFNNNQWNYFVLTRFSNGTTLFFINNNLVISSNSFNPTKRTATLRTGEREGGNHAFGGLVDEISIWNKTLTQSEITALYNSGAGSRPTTTTTTTFTNTFNAGDVVDFNYLFGDTDGDVGKSETRRFTIDSTAPTISLNYPTSLIDYEKLNGTLQLNFTATDDNLDKVWYNYNGTNVTIAGAVSGVYNISNITLSSKKNVTIYANDTAGNLNSEVFGWDYKVFENSRSFVNETYAKVSNPFIVNITSTNISSVILNYNGANYTTNLIPSGLNRISSVNVLSPLVSNDTNITFYWLFVLTDGSVIQSPSSIQTIRYLVIGNTYSNLIYNITIRNENNNSIIANTNVTMTYEVEYGFDINSILGTANFNDNKLANKNISSNIFSSLYLKGNIIYSADNFIGRNYHFLENNISSPKNVTLYLASDTDAFVKSISVVDEAGRGKPALYKQYRNIGGVNVLVASEQLDVTGKSTISFVPNVQYIFEFETTDCGNLSKNIIFFDQSEYQQVLSCSGYDPDDYINEFEGMLVSFSPNGIFYVDNDTEADNSFFYGNVSGTSSFCSSIDTISFSVYNSNGNLISNTNANSCSSLSVTGYFSNYAVGKMYVLLNSGEEKTISFRWIKTLTQKDYSDYNVLNLIKEVGNSEDILGIEWKMKLLFSFIGLFAIIIALATFGRRYNLSNFVMLVIVDIYIWFMSFIGWANLNFGSSEGGFSTLISQYAIFFFAILGTIGIIATKEDEYS